MLLSGIWECIYIYTKTELDQMCISNYSQGKKSIFRQNSCYGARNSYNFAMLFIYLHAFVWKEAADIVYLSVCKCWSLSFFDEINILGSLNEVLEEPKFQHKARKFLVRFTDISFPWTPAKFERFEIIANLLLILCTCVFAHSHACLQFKLNHEIFPHIRFS